MAENEKPEAIARDVVVVLDYLLKVDGEVVDSTEDSAPIVFLHGHENILPGLEQAIFGMTIGESRHVSLKARDAYGEIDEEAFVDVPREEMPDDIEIEPGFELTVTDEDGEEVDAVIESVDGDMVRLDLNHPLAGKDLEFDVTVVDLRAAEPEELEHGHAHGEDDEDEDELDLV